MEDLRLEFVTAAEKTNNFSALCREFGITRKTGYKWVERYKKNQPLSDRSKKPETIANKTDPEIENLIVSYRSENPAWGARKIRKNLKEAGFDNLPCEKTLNNILSRNGCISPEESLMHQPYKRFEMEKCNEMWQTDFKGQFLMADGKYCFPLDILDDHSRFLIRITACPNTKNVVIPAFKAAFAEYGMPRAILSDNGAQFAGFRNGYTQFEKWLMNLDILPIHGRALHPQTQGKIERFHRTLNKELIKETTFADIADAERQLQLWRDKYNKLRPHEALNMKYPADVYEKSKREYTDTVPQYEYGGQYHIIKVNSWGYLRFDKYQIYLSETMANEHIEMRPNPLGDSLLVCYRNFIIAEFDPDTGTRINRTIRRL